MITNQLPLCLQEIQEHIFAKCEYNITNVLTQEESKDYSAYHFELKNQAKILKIVSRAAKITPKKVGQFVVLWKRINKGAIQPYHFADDVDFFVINVKKNTHLGQFIFPKNVLIAQKIVSTDFIEGKRAIRVYPPWDEVTSKQAKQTQKWQLNYFVDISDDNSINLERIKLLYTFKKI